MRISSLPGSLHALVLVAALAACASEGARRAHGAPPELTTCERLSGDEIRSLFANVEDRAVVHDRAGGHARNRWCADGSFTSSWTTEGGTGSLEGRWHVDGALRCVSVASGLPDGGAVSRCGPLYRCNDRIASVNDRGEIHGLHMLSPTPCPSRGD